MITITIQQSPEFYQSEFENLLRASQHATIELALACARGKGNEFTVTDETDDGVRTVTIVSDSLQKLHYGFLAQFSRSRQSLRIECDNQRQYESLAREWDFLHSIEGPDGESTASRRAKKANAALDAFTESVESSLLMPSNPERDA